MTLDQLNALPQSGFAAALGAIFEHSPWIPERAWARRPFASVDALHAALCATLAEAAPEDQIALVRAHPELAGKAAVRGELTEASTREKSGAGLDRCSPEEFAQLVALNRAYGARFGFPFILAVRGHTRSSVIANLAARLERAPEAERAEALRQIERIARFRLNDLLGA
jgi:2-oxo-4-hydroxy-4-carboxy-5-ureidoimidazoline decarboxylase